MQQMGKLEFRDDMRLENYWWLLIWPLLFGTINAIFIPKREELVLGKRVVRWNWMPALVLAAPFIPWAAWRPRTFGDTGMYRVTFLSMPTGLSNMAEYVASRSKGKGFVAFEYLFKTLVSHSEIAFFFIIALIQIVLLVIFFRKYSCDYWFSFFLFIASTDYLSWMHNGIRQFVAVTMVLFCIPLLAKKKYIAACIVILAAALIHVTVLIALPFVFVVNGRAWNARTVLYILAMVVAIIFVDRVSDFIVKSMEDTVYQRDIRIYLNDDGTHILRVLFYAIPTLLSLVFRPYIDKANDPLINICVNLSIISTGFYVLSYFTSGILIGAIPIYFSLANYILLPWLIEEVFNRDSVKVLKAGFIGVFSVFFYYQVGVTWHLL